MTDKQVLEKLRRICLSLPETSERPSHGAPTFFVREKRAFLRVVTRSRTAPSGSSSRRTSALAAGSGVRLDRGLDWDELAGIAEDAYAEVAPAKLVREAFGTA